MKRITIISFTRAGSKLNQGMNQKLSRNGYCCDSFATPQYAGGNMILPIPEDKTIWFGENWGKTSYIFIGAAGIAIRYILPWLKDKYTDSAVLVLDEKGKFVIPLVAGHIGGAVELARIIAKEVGATPVITTATDINEKFAVDVFAKEHGLVISDRSLAKEISAAVLNEISIGWYSEREYQDIFPKEIIRVDDMEELDHYSYGIAVLSTDHYHDTKKVIQKNVLCLLQNANMIVGIGCKKGISMEHIYRQLTVLLEEHHLTIWNVKLIASIDIKREEPGILELTKAYGIPYRTYSTEELNQIESVSLKSSFVQEMVGVDNVCERAAKRAAGSGILIQPKVCMDSVTFSLVKECRKRPVILVFAGTTEGREIIEYLMTYKVTVIACVATEYGKSCLEHINVHKNGNLLVREGRLSKQEIIDMMKTEHVELVIDATHPFATVVTENIKNACKTTEIEYLRLLRKESSQQEQKMIYVDTIKEAVTYLEHTSGNILISTGSKELELYTQLSDYRKRCYARVLSTKQSVEDSVYLGFQGAHLIAMQGPFSKKMNCATLEQTKAKYFVTKESGATGGFAEKVDAAKETGVQLVVIGRPKEEGKSMAEIQKILKGIYQC
ncbi:MAG: precorrin-6A reductase [Lachnospiraceae bacterium]